VLETPAKFPEGFERLGAKRPRGVVLVGPTGTGKTLLVQAFATAAGRNLIAVKGSDLYSPWHAESALNVAELFEQARELEAILFIDEAEAIAIRRERLSPGELTETRRVLAEMLVRIDGADSEDDGVSVVLATNLPGLIDSAMTRSRRIGAVIPVLEPKTAAERRQILTAQVRRLALAPDVDVDAIARRTGGFTGADLEELHSRAATHALARTPQALDMKMDDYDRALSELNQERAEWQRARKGVEIRD
jgi:ATP-dependent 26S proteasome regulatory subunit